MPTAQEFIEKWPLYTKANIRGFSPPKSITRMCDVCKKNTTWALGNAVDVNQGSHYSCYTAGYRCVLCEQQYLLVLYEGLDWHKAQNSSYYSYHAVRKIGQIPPQSIDIPADLQERLGATAEHYKKALVCRNTNYGIAAVAYMRRVIEEKTDDLIDVVVELAKSYHIDGKIVEALTRAKEQIQYEQKVKLASEVIPPSLMPGGVNPLGQLFKHLSMGVHDKTDDECILIFDDLKLDFEFVFRNLYIQAQEASEFAKRVQQRAGKEK